jgi:DNA-binding MarR family transcriptional regulator
VELLVVIARKIIKGRELRSQNLRQGLFSDPAWDMLLDLFLARLVGQKVCVSSLCIASRVPATTALRWIKDMELHGELIRHADPTDKRRAYIDISDAAFEAVRTTLLAAEARPSRCEALSP